MTCIVGLIHEGTTWIGGDSAGVATNVTYVGKTKKVFRQGSYVIGFAGSYDIAQTIRGLDLPEPKGSQVVSQQDISHFMEVEFSAYLKDNVFANSEDASLLVGIEGQLFEVDDKFGVFEPAMPFNAIGGASDFALGALLMAHITHGPDFTHPILRVQDALLVAHRIAPGTCQPPFTIMHDGPGGELPDVDGQDAA